MPSFPSPSPRRSRSCCALCTRGADRGRPLRRRHQRRRRGRAAARRLRAPSSRSTCPGLDRLVNLDIVSHTATLQPGLRGPQAEALLNARGYTLGHFPQSYELATIGGYAATRSAGQASTGYGRSDELVVGLTVATPAGTLRLGRAPRSAAGPDLRQLMLGSEGAFGVITDVTMAVRPVPAHKRYEAWFFPTSRPGSTRCAELEQHKLAPEVSRLSDEDETDGQPRAVRSRRRACPARYLKARRLRAMAIFGWEGEPELVSAPPQARA